MGFQVVVPSCVGSEVADSGLAGRSAVVGVEVGDGVVDVDSAGDGCGVGEDVGGVAEQNLFTQAGRDFVGVDGGVAGWEVDDGLQADGAVIPEQLLESAG